MPPLIRKRTRHVTLIDEAHTIAPNAGPAAPSEDFANAKAHSAEAVERALAECAGYGTGLWLIDQLHSKVAPGVTKNTRTKIIHCMPDGEERDLAGDSIVLAPFEKDAIARQPVGEAFFFPVGAFRACRIKAVNLFSDYNYPFAPPPKDQDLLSAIESEPWFIENANIRLVAEMDIVLERMNRLIIERQEIEDSVHDANERLRKCLGLSGDAMKRTARSIESEIQRQAERCDLLHRRFRSTFYESFMDGRVPDGVASDVVAQHDLLIARYTSEIAEPTEKLKESMAQILKNCKRLLSGG